MKLDDDYVDDGTVYDIKDNKKEDNEKAKDLLALDINYKELCQKFSFKLRDKEIVLQASLEREKKNPNIELITKGHKVIARYSSQYQAIGKTNQDFGEAKLNEFDVPKDEKMKQTVFALILGPFWVFKFSWKLSLLVFTLAVGMIFILPELLVSIPIISSGIVWSLLTNNNSKRKNQGNSKYKDQSNVLIQDKQVNETSVFDSYNVFLKKEKQVWLASLLGFALSGFGLFYVSWVYAIAILAISILMWISAPILLVSIPLISLALGLFASLDTNKKHNELHLYKK